MSQLITPYIHTCMYYWWTWLWPPNCLRL